MKGFLALLTIILVPIALVVMAWALGPLFDWFWSRLASGHRDLGTDRFGKQDKRRHL